MKKYFFYKYRFLKKNENIFEKKYDLQRKFLEKQEKELLNLKNCLLQKDEKIQELKYWRKEYEQICQKLQEQVEINNIQETELRESINHIQEIKFDKKAHKNLLFESEQRTINKFENIIKEKLVNNDSKIEEKNQQNLNNFFIPFKEQLESFRREINDKLGQDSCERNILKYEINQLQQLNSQITKETINLTKALKGDIKTQGNWGETVLSRVLECSGLREGYEYEKQVTIHLKDKNRIQPDIIVRLPQGRDVVIDAKTTLIAYEKYFNTDDKLIREKALQEHIKSIRNHIRLLSSKNYQKSPGLRSLDYVLMFISIEPAFLLAINHQPDLLNEALQQNVMLVSPTTLLVALKTINNLWKSEYQNRNSQLIAKRASRLYDKIRLFVDDIINIGQNIDKAQKSYENALKKLIQGRGNLISQTENFKKLGVEIKSSINQKILNQTEFWKEDNLK
ncbi:DNA recombination protein [Candidatus Tachikawaea gelatinosa]|uniref:DNA recombination protein RmuC n=1 Tax=Candidatus Tachikawaea gelatinosa TaxID=1410383 RepID=A0A090AIP0_9ENTR|nr:DNA recombination protein [Candidatus Tachikawaea gelatinosa]